MTGLEDRSRPFMAYHDVSPDADDSLVIGRSVAPSVTECHPCGGQNGGQEFAVSFWRTWLGSASGADRIRTGDTRIRNWMHVVHGRTLAVENCEFIGAFSAPLFTRVHLKPLALA